MAEDKITEEALAWLIRINETDFHDWEAFEDWIDRDPAHGSRYRRLAKADAEVAAELREGRNESPIELRSPLFRRVALGAGLAAIAASLVVLMPRHVESETIEAAPGMPRSIVLASGDRIDLNGGARIVVEHGLGRHVRLDRGEALFRVTHNAAQPFTLVLGETSVRDVGTVFDAVRASDGTIDVAVSEGSVLFDPDGAARSIARGESVRMAARRNMIVVAKIDPDAVGAWQNGRLKYSNAPLSEVAAGISRAAGYPVAVAPSVAERRFTGTLVIDDRETLVMRAAAMLELDAHKQGGGWQLVEPPHTSR